MQAAASAQTEFVNMTRLVLQLSQVRQAAASLERVAGAMARQAAIEHHGGRDNRTAFTVGPVDNRDQHREQRRASTSISF